jgi:opacity protein-like surface antigen
VIREAGLSRVARSRSSWAIAAWAVIALSLAADRATAQGYLDVYGGAAFTSDDELVTRLAGSSLRDDVDFDPSAEVGIRGGMWFPDLPWLGIASDLSYFELDGPSSGVDHTVGGVPVRTGENVDIDVFPISVLLMLRTKLFMLPCGSQFGLQPYVGVGPGLFVSWVHDDALTIGIGANEESIDDISYEIGLDTRGGLRLHVTPWVSLFAEYRFTYYEPDLEDDLFGVDVDVESQIATHHVVAGLGFQF